MLKEQRVEIDRDLNTDGLMAAKQISKMMNISNFGSSKDDQMWRIAVKNWLIKQDSTILDVSFMKRMVKSVLAQSGSEFDIDQKPSQYYKLCSNNVRYGTKKIQKYYIGYAPTKNKSYPHLLIEYTSDKKCLKRTPFTNIRMFGLRSRKDLDELVEDLISFS